MLSIIIVNWNTREPLRACLASIRAHPPDRPCEVIVVDNASSDGSAAMVAGEFPEAVLVAEQSNWGYAKGNNLGIARAQGSLLLTLNPDTEFADDALEEACQRLEAYANRPLPVPHLTLSGATAPREDRRIGVLAPRLVGPDGETQASVRGFPTLLSVFGAATGLDRLFPRGGLARYRLPLFDYDSEQLAPQPMGTFLLFRRSVIAVEAGPFDESFPIFFNEVDLLKRLHERGFECIYCPDIQVKHLHGASTRQRRKSMIWESHRSLVRYLQKHSSPGARLILPLVALVVYGAAFVRARGYHRGFRA